MFQKFSISLPAELVEEINKKYPDVAFSKAVAKLVRAGLDQDSSIFLSATSNTDTPDLTETIRAIVQEEMSRIQIPPVSQEPVIVTNPVIVRPKTLTIDPEKQWLTNGELASLLPESWPRPTRTSRVSRAIASGKLSTNGLKRQSLRITKESAQTWLETLF